MNGFRIVSFKNLYLLQPALHRTGIVFFFVISLLAPLKARANITTNAPTEPIFSEHQALLPPGSPNLEEFLPELHPLPPNSLANEPSLIHPYSSTEPRITSQIVTTPLPEGRETTPTPPPSPQPLEREPTPPPDPKYIIPPRLAPEEKVHPFTTTLPLNETPISHLSEGEFSVGYTLANTLESDISFNGILELDTEIVESVTRTNIYTVDQNSTYLQVRTVPYQRKVTTTTTDPQTLTGLQLQLSLTGACILENTPTDQQCTYTPGLVIDRNSIDPQFLVPTRVFQTSEVGDLVTPESFAVMRLPGFQRGADGQEIGVDLYFPNIGAFPRDSPTEQTEIDREEEIDNTIAGTYSNIRQIVKANDTEAVLARTIHGMTFLVDDENRLINTAVQLGAQILPDVIPSIEESTNPVNSNINRNLFLAANNIRLPASSFTIYSAGIGRAESLTPEITQLNQIPTANYNSIWLGLSPVIERNRRPGMIFYSPTSEQRIIARAGAEGGADTNLQFMSIVNDDVFSTASLQDFYTQIYLQFLAQDVNYITSNIYSEKTTYYPHLSLTGNLTSSQDLIRYYGGVIASEDVKAYLGADYTLNATNGWSVKVGGIGYINPDRDYYSQVWGSVSKAIKLGQDANFVLAAGFNYALDGESRIGDAVSASTASTINASGRLNWGIISLGLTHYFGDILPNSYEDQLLADFTIRPTNRLRLSAYFSPINENASRSRYGASLVLKLGEGYNSPTLSLNWQNQEYDYGRGTFGNELLVRDNVFTVLFRMGTPANPFVPKTVD